MPWNSSVIFGETTFRLSLSFTALPVLLYSKLPWYRDSIHYAPRAASKTARVSLLFPLPTTSSERNFFRVLLSFVSCSAVISSTAVAVEVNR